MSHRPQKVASLIQKVISEIIMHELNDPIFKEFITITEVQIGYDLKKATVYFRVYNKETEKIEKALKRAKGYIKKLLAEKITLKFIPEIEFKKDDRLEKEEQLEKLFKKIQKQKNEKSL